MPERKEFTFLSSDGKTRIHACEWLPDVPARACVEIIHGVAEYCARYDAFAMFLAENGFVVASNDLLGHGQSISSPDDLGFFAEKDGWSVVVRDERMLHDMLKSRYVQLPIFLFGHNMGSFIAQTYIMTYPIDFDGCILSGTGCQSGAVIAAGKLAARGAIVRYGAKHHSESLQKMAFGAYNKSFQPGRTPFDWLSRDEAVVDAYVADPLCGYTATAGLFYDMMGGLQFIADPRNIARVNTDMPMYIFSGALDPVGENGRGVARRYDMYKKAGVKDLSLKLYPGGRHEMLNEINREEVYQDVLSWLVSKL